MGFQVSPGVQVTEKDLTNVVPAVATSIAGIVIAAEKGPCDQITAIASEEELVSTFGKPKADNAEDWFCGANFLGYGNALRVVRSSDGSMKNAVSSGTAILIKNNTHYRDGDGSTGPFDGGSATVGQWAAKLLEHGEIVLKFLCVLPHLNLNNQLMQVLLVVYLEHTLRVILKLRLIMEDHRVVELHYTMSVTLFILEKQTDRSIE